MKLLLSLAAVIALATAELYKENEDFQFSRSSSDEGHKAGYYGAQRGNMGGNYEKAHNMDSLAQHQMSGAVRQVEGELGDAANTKSGSVFTSANSRGIYGSGRYDTSNLAGRNFNEGVNYDSHSAMSSHNAHSQYAGQSSHHSGYTGSSGLNSGYHSGSLHSGNLQAVDSVGAGGYDYAQNAEHSSGYESKSGYTKHSSSGYGSNAGSNAQIRLVGHSQPARVVVRPGTTVYIPIAAQSYHDASYHDQNSINSDAEVLSSANHHAQYVPSTDAKSYESSYSYRKEWEKHHGYPYPTAVPLAVPTYPKNSELYEDSQASSGSHNALSSSHYNNYNSNVKSSSAMHSHQSGYNAAHDSASNLYSNANTHGALNSDIGYAGDVGSKPKSYQSSYAYHKSWERQGDPYVIIPGSDGQSGKVIDASDQHDYTKGGKVCCVDSEGHIRVARSYNQNQEAENLNQQSQNLEDQGQQTQDLTQQSMSNWNGHLVDFSQQTQDLSQESQANLKENLEDFGQQTQDLTQQSQTNWNQNFGQQSQDLTKQSQTNLKENLEDFGQQTQDLTQQTQTNWNQNLEDFGQQTQDLTQQSQKYLKDNLKDFGQQTQDLTQQTQTNWNQNIEDFGQQTQDLGQETVNRWDNIRHPGQQTESQQTQDSWNTHTLGQDDFGQQSQNKWELGGFGQTDHGSGHHNLDRENTTQGKEVHTATNNLNNFHQSTRNVNNYEQQNNWHQETQNQEHFSQETQGMWHKLDESKHNMNITSNSQVKPVWEQTEDNRPQFSGNTESDNKSMGQSNVWKFIEKDHQNTNTNQQTSEKNVNERTDSTSQGTSIVNLWDKINNLDQFSMSENNNQNGYKHSRGQSTVDNSFQNNWSHSFSQSSDSGMTQQSTYMPNHYGTHYGGFKPMWSSGTINQKPSTEKPTNNLAGTDDLTQTSNSFGGYQGKEFTTTVRPVHDTGKTLFEGSRDSRAHDVGRGDIGAEESSIDDLRTNTKLEVNRNNDYVNPSTVSYAFENKRYKTPEEIETLSLTTQTEKIAINKDNNTFNKNVTEFNNQQESENTLSVVSLQEWLNEQRKHDKNQYENSGMSTSTPNIGSVYSTNRRQIESHQFGSQSESSFYYNRPTTSTSFTPVSISQNKPKDVADRKPNDFKDLHEDQGTEDLAQQTQQLGDFGSFVQENKNVAQEAVQQNQPIESLGQFGQQSNNSDQQVQSSWGQGLVDFGQQQQSGWESKDQVQETQQLEKSGRFNEGQYQTQDFYNQRYTNGKEQRKIEDLQSAQSPQMPQVIEEQKTKTEAETPAPPVTTTEKPGFWKSVGSKFSSAKDSVSSWFKRS